MPPKAEQIDPSDGVEVTRHNIATVTERGKKVSAQRHQRHSAEASPARHLGVMIAVPQTTAGFGASLAALSRRALILGGSRARASMNSIETPGGEDQSRFIVDPVGNQPGNRYCSRCTTG